MTASTDAGHWQETAQHLVQAHGALPGALTSYAPTLEQLHFAHADSHEALVSNGAAAPDGHTRTGPLDPGYPYARDSSFRPFPPGPTASCAPPACRTSAGKPACRRRGGRQASPRLTRRPARHPAERLTRTASNRRPGRDRF
jgi:hypothetical protein